MLMLLDRDPEAVPFADDIHEPASLDPINDHVESALVFEPLLDFLQAGVFQLLDPLEAFLYLLDLLFAANDLLTDYLAPPFLSRTPLYNLP